MTKTLRVPIRCSRCRRPLGYAEGVVVSVVCSDCVDRHLEDRVFDLEQQVDNLMAWRKEQS